MEYVRLFLGEKIGNKEISQSDIGIVTPFLLQSKNLREALQKESFVDVAVGTVETFQGQEKEIIIISAVRSKIFVHEDRKHIGFLSNPRRFNVALTRAKSNLVVIGNPTALQADENWYHFLKFCRDNNACRGEKFELIDGIHRLYMLMHATNLGKVCEDSLDLFPESFKILPIGKFFILFLFFNILLYYLLMCNTHIMYTYSYFYKNFCFLAFVSKCQKTALKDSFELVTFDLHH